MADIKFKDFVMPEKPSKYNNFSKTPLDELPLTMSYTPMQKIGVLYEEAEGLCRGTIFPELDKPFYGKFTGASKEWK